MIYSGVNESLKATRKAYYEITDDLALVNLIRRPYVFDCESRYSYEKYKEISQTAKSLMVNKAIARSKLKGLRNAYGGGKTEAENYLIYIKSHAKSEKEVKAAEMLENIFNENNEAILFDYLDIMDIALEGEGTHE